MKNPTTGNAFTRFQHEHRDEPNRPAVDADRTRSRMRLCHEVSFDNVAILNRSLRTIV
jgi:hypothetical protein